MQAYEPNYQSIKELGITKVIFENKADESYLSIFGYKPEKGHEMLIECDFSCEFSVLTDLLLTDYEFTKKLIDEIITRIQTTASDELIEIDVVELYDEPILIKDVEIIIYRPFEKNENGEFHEVPKNEEFYLIDSVKQSWAVLNKELVAHHSELDEHLKLLYLSYIYYLRLLNQSFSQTEARKLSGLKSEMLFRLATINYKIFDYKESEN
jgi:hypothetical protein